MRREPRGGFRDNSRLLSRGRRRSLLGFGDGRQRRFAIRDHGGPGTHIFEALIEQCGHLPIARSGRRPAHNHAYQPMPVAHGRGSEIEARGADVSGLDSVRTLVPVEQTVVIVDCLTSKVEFPSREIAIFPREITVQSESQLHLVSRRRVLVGIRQARSVAVDGAGHAELPSLACHVSSKRRLAAAQFLREHGSGVIRGSSDEAEDQVSNGYRFAGSETELGRRPAGRLVRD